MGQSSPKRRAQLGSHPIQKLRKREAQRRNRDKWLSPQQNDTLKKTVMGSKAKDRSKEGGSPGCKGGRKTRNAESRRDPVGESGTAGLRKGCLLRGFRGTSPEPEWGPKKAFQFENFGKGMDSKTATENQRELMLPATDSEMETFLAQNSEFFDRPSQNLFEGLEARPIGEEKGDEGLEIQKTSEGTPEEEKENTWKEPSER